MSQPISGETSDLKTRTLRYVEACDQIRSDILDGTFGFGQRLKIAKLAERYGTSHMPIREALRLLNGEGLVTIEPNKGVRVRSIDARFVKDLFDVRIAIETLQARLAAQRRMPTHIEELRKARLSFEHWAAREEVAKLLAANRRFHQIVGAASGNTEASEVEERHWRMLPAIWSAFGYPLERIPIVIDDHRHLEALICEGDADGAAIIAAAHCFRAKLHMIATINRGGQLGF